MATGNRLVAAVLGAALSFLIIVLGARPAAADTAPGLYRPTDDRAADALVYLFMHETTSLQANGNGEERIEFLVSNNGLTPISTAEFYFQVSSTDYWGISAWDAQGSLNYQVTIDDDEVHITLHFRDSVGLGEQYRYFFAINFPGLATQSGGEWRFDWGTFFPVAEFRRTVNLPGGAAVTYANPAPTEQTPEYVRWVRYGITQFIFNLRYTLRALTDLELARDFVPYFRMHPQDIYVPMRMQTALEHAVCYSGPNAAQQDCSPGLLGGSWVNDDDSYIDFHGWPGGGLNASGSSHKYYNDNLRQTAANDPVVYARVIPVGSNRTVIQYWLYYYYNSWGHQGGLPGALHEGDWELVQVVLDANKQPLYAAYAQHFGLNYTDLKGASKKEWNDLKPGLSIENGHPIVYPALGSHASYFGPYKYLYNFDQSASETAALVKPTVYLLQPTTNDPWVYYKGKWGQKGQLLPLFQGGPSSPAHQGVKWSNPLGWSDSAIDWDEFAGHHIGKFRAHVGAPCDLGVTVVGSGDMFGWIFNDFKEEIDNGEYVVNESAGKRSLILHDTYRIDTRIFILMTTCPRSVTPSNREAAAQPELTVEYYDATADELVTAVFELPANWTPATTIATLEFTDGASPMLEVDRDNNGSIDEIVPPESVTSEPIEEGHSTRLFMPSIVRN